MARKKGIKANRPVTAMTTAAICGDVVRHLSEDGSVENVFKKRETADTLKRSMAEVMRIYRECLKNGRYAQVEQYIKSSNGRLSDYGPVKQRNHPRTKRKDMEEYICSI